MIERTLSGLAAASGVAVGRTLRLRERPEDAPGAGGESEVLRALAALDQVAEALGCESDALRLAGRCDEAEILMVSQMMVEDPSLLMDVRAQAAVVSAEAALVAATERYGQLLDSLPDPLLAARASDVRALGRRAARLLAGASPLMNRPRKVILVARDLGPADLAELRLDSGDVRGIALAEGAATSHVAIMARSLGIPMLVGLGETLLDVTDGTAAVVDADEGVLRLAPSPVTLARARAQAQRRQRQRRRRADARSRSPTTRDGQRIALLCNVGSVADVRAALDAGADGVGLLRTELAFLDARAWPSEGEHLAALTPLLAPLSGKTATVRTLDFGADKTPPFLAGTEARGLALMLTAPDAFTAQVRAVARAGAATRLRLLLPLVQHAAMLRQARTLINECLAAVGWVGRPPPLGAMIESAEAAELADEIAAEADFLSIGTNDLVQSVLGFDRRLPLASVRAAAEPQVLHAIARVVEAAKAQHLRVEVCGEAAGEPQLVELLIGLGVRELSVAPARLDDVRATVRRVSARRAAIRALDALAAPIGEHVLHVHGADSG